MFQQIKGNLPDVAERMMIALYAMTLRADSKEREGGYGDVYIEGKGVAFVIGGKWSSYRHKVMLRLEEIGCVKCERGFVRGTSKKEQWRYSITIQAMETISNRIDEGLKGYYVKPIVHNNKYPMDIAMEMMKS